MRIRVALLIGLLLGPLLVGAAIASVVVIGELGGRSPFSDGGVRNSAEAAYVGDASAVIRFLRRGEDPLRLYPVRPELLSVAQVSTLEAAAFSKRWEMVWLLEDEGAIVGAARGELTCLADDLDARDIVSYLAPNGVECEPGETLGRIMARTR